MGNEPRLFFDVTSGQRQALALLNERLTDITQQWLDAKAEGKDTPKMLQWCVYNVVQALADPDEEVKGFLYGMGWERHAPLFGEMLLGFDNLHKGNPPEWLRKTPLGSGRVHRRSEQVHAQGVLAARVQALMNKGDTEAEAVRRVWRSLRRDHKKHPAFHGRGERAGAHCLRGWRQEALKRPDSELGQAYREATVEATVEVRVVRTLAGLPQTAKNQPD